MMAGIGEASSVIGILASAVQAARVLADFAIEVRDATADATAIGKDAQDLSSILASLQKWLLMGTVKPAAADSLEEALNNCLQTTDQLREVIEPYTKTVRSRSRLTWRSLKWTLKKQEVRELRERWQHSKSTLAISLTIINTYTGNQELGAKIEASKDTLRQDLRELQQKIVKQRVTKIDNASTRGRQGSLSNGTDANFPLQRFLEELPPEDHPWARMSEPEDVLSLRSLSMYDAGTRSSTPEAEPDVAVERLMPSTSSRNEDVRQGPRNILPDLKLTMVVSEPVTRLEIRDLDSALHLAFIQEKTQIGRPTTLPYRGMDRAIGADRPCQNVPSRTQATQRCNGPLHQALIDEDTYKIMSLLTTDIDVNELGRDKRTPLHVCALLNDKVTAQALLRTGRVDLSRRDVHGRTPFQCALEVGNDGLACLLLQHGAQIEEVAGFVIEMTHRMHNPAEEKVAHACLAWLSKKDDLKMENDFVDSLVRDLDHRPVESPGSWKVLGIGNRL